MSTMSTEVFILSILILSLCFVDNLLHLADLMIPCTLYPSKPYRWAVFFRTVHAIILFFCISLILLAFLS